MIDRTVAAGVAVAAAVIAGPNVWTISRVVLGGTPSCASMDGGC
jgi:hypothetical protein